MKQMCGVYARGCIIIHFNLFLTIVNFLLYNRVKKMVGVNYPV